MRHLILACATATVAASPALANGGCSETVYSGGAAGTIRPLHQSTVRLLSEDLALAVVNDHGAWQYAADARYTLSNPGAPLKVQYAVPIVTAVLVPHFGPMCDRDQRPAEVADTIRISVAKGPAVPCTFREQAGPRPTGLAIDGDQLEAAGATLAGYCTADLEIPSGKAVELRLRYTAPLFSSRFTPGPAKECASGPLRCASGDEQCRQALAWQEELCKPKPSTSGAPSLYYPMGMAGTWAGTPASVAVAVKLGAFTWEVGSTRGLPPDAVLKDGTLRFGWRSPDLRGKDFSIALQPKGGALSRERDRDETRCAPGAPAARASSTLVDQYSVYDPERAADGDAATAWCVDPRDGGVGEWLELTWPREEDGHERHAQGLFVLPGLGTDQRLWKANGRVKRIRYGPCAPGARLAEAELPLSDALEDAVVKVTGELSLSETDAGSCLRVEIVEVAPGAKSRDVCLSELIVPWLCF